MNYQKEQRDKARIILENRKSLAKERALQRKNEVYAKIPRIKEIDRLLSLTGINVSKAILNGENIEKNIELLKQENLNLQKEKAELLIKNNYTEDFLMPNFKCNKCSDTGFKNNSLCDCHIKLLKELSYEKLRQQVDLNAYSFANFSLSYYPEKSATAISPKSVMEQNLVKAKMYAENFSPTSQSLLLLGKTGLGKTHLSVAIAGKVIESGYDVLYCSAQNLLHRLEKEKFSSDNQNDFEDYMQILLSTDLLIIDDLGAEFSTSFTTSAIYNIINSRLLQTLPTIINSNLDTTKKLEEAYSARFVSRLLGNYDILTFMGEDIRIKKKYN